MKIKLDPILVEDLVKGYKDNEEEGVFGYSGKLNIRPPYQREFIYSDKKRNAVIDSINKNFPLNVMYWVKTKSGDYEILDGQQRTVSICQYVASIFSINGLLFNNLQDEERDKILNYELMVYFCEGTDKETLDWFQTINIAGEKLENQELRNAIYSGVWVTEAKKYFSKTGCVASKIANHYIKGKSIRQAYLEKAIEWRVNSSRAEDINEFMAKNQHKPDAEELWSYFERIIKWIKATFPVLRRKEMLGQNWGSLYNKFGEQNLNPETLEKQVGKLMADEDVLNKNGIYRYVLDGDKKHLSLRLFSEAEKRTMYERQGKKCNKTGKHCPIEDLEADHIKPWSRGGSTTLDNGQMILKEDNKAKSDK